MKKDIADKWVKALRSGKYKQGEAYLRSVDEEGLKYCCLGVLCDVLNVPVPLEACVLPEEVQDQVDMHSPNGGRGWSRSYSLSEFNDRLKYDFNQIADIIEAEWETL